MVVSALAVIQGQLNRLDFQLADANFLGGEEWNLLGARYCSIQGQLAAQFKLQKQGKPYTFYQAPMPRGMKQISPTSHVIDGVQVKIWQEKGLLMAVAGN